MSQSGPEAGAFAVLELLANGVPSDRYAALLDEGRRSGTTPEELAALERAVQLGLSVRVQAEAQQQRESRLSALFDAGLDLAAPQDLGTLLKVSLRRARLLLAADMSWIGLYDEENDGNDATDRPVIRASDGHITNQSIGLDIAPGMGLGSATTQHPNPSPFWTPDYLADERIHHGPAIDDVVRIEGLRAILAVPLLHGTRSIGTLYVGDRSVRHFTAEEVALLNSLADLAAVAIERVRLVERNAAQIAGLERRAGLVEAGLQDARGLCEIHRRLTGLVLADGDLDVLVKQAGRELDAALRVYAVNGTVLTATEDLPEFDPAAITPLGVDTPAAGELVPVADGLWATPIEAGAGRLGLLLLRPGRPWTEDDRQLLRVVTQVVALQLLLDSSRSAFAEGQVREEFLGNLLNGPGCPPRQLQQQARRLGIDLREEHIVVIARPEGESCGRLASWASSYARRMGGLKTMHQGSAVLLLPGTDAGAAARAVAEELPPWLGHPATVSSAGPVADPACVRHSFREALRCLEAMTSLGATGRASSVHELGFVGVLLADNHDVDGFIDSAIGPLIDYDIQRFTHLTRTLETYFEAGGSPTNAAKKLHVHANTVARRLERIGELLGPAWQEPGRALEVQLALRVFRVRESLRRRDEPGAPQARDEGRGQHT